MSIPQNKSADLTRQASPTTIHAHRSLLLPPLKWHRATCFPVSTAPPPPLLGRRVLGLSSLSPDRCRSLEGLFTILTHAFFVGARGGGSIVMRCTMKGRRRVNAELQGPDASGFPLAFLTSSFANLNQTRSCLIDLKHIQVVLIIGKTPRPTP